jgi:hypothetical protein
VNLDVGFYVEQFLDLTSLVANTSLNATVFAPTNAAFNNLMRDLGITVQQALLQYRDSLVLVRP